MRWLLLKDLRILARSPLLVALLVLYPIVIAVLIGFAISRSPDKPEVAIYNGLAGQPAQVELGGREINLAHVTADVYLMIGTPNTPYQVRLIQGPRPGTQKCNAGDPGVAGAVLNTDGTASVPSRCTPPAFRRRQRVGVHRGTA